MGKKKLSRQIRKKGLPPGSLVYTGSRPERSPDVYTISYSAERFNIDAFYDNAGVKQFKESKQGVLWIDIRNLSDVSFIEKVGTDFEIHPLALEDVLNTQQRAKFEAYDNGLFIVLPNLRLDAQTLELHHEQISLFLSRNGVVSFQEDPDDTFQSVRARLSDVNSKIRKKQSDYLAFQLADTIIDDYFLVLDEFETAIVDLEADLHLHGAAESYRDRIFSLKRSLSLFRLRLQPLRDTMSKFQRAEGDLLDPSNDLYFRDLVDHVAQVQDSSDNFREMMIHIESLYQVEVGNRLNHVMRLLTVISTIFIPLSFIAGIYGMNFEYMPELHWRYGYFFVLGFMFFVMVGMLIYFKRKRWI